MSPGSSMRGMTAVVIALAVAVAAAGVGLSSKNAIARPVAHSAGLSLAAIKAKVRKLEKPVHSVAVNVPRIKGLPSLQGKKILIVPALGLVFNPSIGVIEQALKPLGVTVQECDGQGNPSTMASCMAEAPTISGVVGVMTIGVPPGQVPNAFAELASDNIPVAAVQQDADGMKSTLGKIGFVGDTPLFIDAITAADDYVIAKSNGHANVVALGDNESSDVMRASQYIVNYLQANCRGCKSLLKEIASTSIGDATSFVSSEILSNPSFDWLIALNQDVSGEAVTQGLQSANATTKVHQGGVGVGLGSMQQVASGTATYVAAISGALNSWNWTDAMLRVIAKKPVPTNYPEVVRLFDASNIHSVSLTPAGTSNFSWFGTANYQQQYYKIWGVK